mmetsp:Transcript_64310/g.172128  ORF Transcript_64310/g.172128 Transcript_64310/m.172128 type:complete len:118 (+) Transcript_64310:165-518(+)
MFLRNSHFTECNAAPPPASRSAAGVQPTASSSEARIVEGYISMLEKRVAGASIAALLLCIGPTFVTAESYRKPGRIVLPSSSSVYWPVALLAHFKLGLLAAIYATPYFLCFLFLLMP